MSQEERRSWKAATARRLANGRGEDAILVAHAGASIMSWQIQAGRRRRWAIAFAVALMAAPGELFAQQQPSGDAAPVCTAKYLDSTVTVGQLKISAFSAEAADCL